MPGSNPLFGLNTLGGALSIQTKDGERSPARPSARSTAATCGEPWSSSMAAAAASGCNWYVAGNLFAEDGWRDESPSERRPAVRQAGLAPDATHDTALSVGYADNALTGNGLQEQRFLERDFASVYTKPDETDNRVDVRQSDDAARWSRTVASAATSTTATSGPTRSTATSTTTRSIRRCISRAPRNRRRWRPPATPGFPTSGANAANTPFPFWRCIGNVLLKTSPAKNATGC